jgi:uncharacterized membrane protein YoaK (UPF0700 family)
MGKLYVILFVKTKDNKVVLRDIVLRAMSFCKDFYHSYRVLYSVMTGTIKRMSLNIQRHSFEKSVFSRWEMNTGSDGLQLSMAA